MSWISFNLICVMAVAVVMAAAAVAQDSLEKSLFTKKRATPKPQLIGESRALHASSRFTFGPRQGDVDKGRRWV